MRSPASCPYRKSLQPSPAAGSDPSPDAGHACFLVGELARVSDEAEIAVADEFCEACCQAREPSPTQLNPLVASKLFMATHRMLGGETAAFLDEAELTRLNHWARDNLSQLCSEPQRPRRLPAYQRRCQYLGEKIGERECKSCTGSVRLKVFACHHQRHEAATIRDCQTCPDYEPLLQVGGAVTSWAVGVTTAPRREPTIARMLESLAAAGWPEFKLFAEPGCEIPALPEGSAAVVRSQKFGAWPNFLLGLSELVLTTPDADAYLMCQDDTVFCKGLRRYLEQQLWPGALVGVVSLHAASHQTREEHGGFFSEDVGWSAWGAQAYVFPNSSARALLCDPSVVNHRQRGIGEGLQNVDSVVGDWCRRAGLPYFLHAPSLTQHIGQTSAIWSENARAEGRRQASDFVGEDTDIQIEMRRRAAPRPQA